MSQETSVNTLHFPKDWKDYSLIDCGNKRKIERFGNTILIRPEPQAIWKPGLSEKDWYKQADAEFIRDNLNKKNTGELEGGWKQLRKTPSHWEIKYSSNNRQLKIGLQFTGFGHLGIFPEQATNWDYLMANLKKDQKVLNLFAYTGVASLAARTSGADVTHLDAVKNVVTWARENMERSNLEGIRWIVEDAFKFVQREVKREKLYDFIILAPPAYGRGPSGEKWLLEELLDQLMEGVSKILKPDGKLILNLYSLGYSPLLCNNLLKSYFPNRKIESGELVLQSETGYLLPLSVFGRI